MQCRVLSLIFSTYQQPFHYPLRFLICSRPESWIRQEFYRFSELTKHIELDDSFLPEYDIELYLNQQFQEIRKDPRYSQVVFPDPWPASRDVRFLVEKADRQFIYVSTAMMFIKAEYTIPTDQLCIILDTISNRFFHSSRESPFNDLDELYLMILRANPDRDKRQLPILAVIVVIQDTFPAFIELLLGYSPGTVTQTLRAMHSVLDVRDREDKITVHHKSFADFLLDQARSRGFFIDKLMWKDSLACRWTKALAEQCRKDPELLRSSRRSAYSKSSWKLVQEWNNSACLGIVSHSMSSELMSKVDAFYHVVLSISAESVGHDMLLHLLAAIHLLSSGGPDFIQLLLGLRREDLDQALQAMDTVIWDEHSPRILVTSLRRTYRFWDFLFDRERSHGFFIEKDYQSDFIAQKCLHLFQMDEGVDKTLVEDWARICTEVDNPTEELLFELGRMDLGGTLTKSLNSSHDLFRDFKMISTWLTSKTNSVALPNLTDQFENVQRGFQLRYPVQTCYISQLVVLKFSKQS
ncbi:hypothetical protein E1B28_003001 [Marasmius oreades]|uniref:Uncharacterized protein n=1 Tax=Marasmius oreades TaxID=181124 RepID=A0A9P7RKT3_9AGAR|nr:uncharacterized protein E1B28_003001 [Marasmius oreades]KAG7085440.1 hypothetical protein E1B28_003001 [Marasmius oreades]